MEMHVRALDDASVTIQYVIQFHCNDGAHPIDIVDIGMPTSAYDKGEMIAKLDEVEQSTIYDSEIVHPGVEVHLTSPIQPGQSGNFELTFNIPNLVWQDTTNSQYASLQITPTWFDGNYMTGTTKLAVTVYIPGDIKPEEVLYQKVPFDEKFQLDDGTIAVSWFYPDTTVDGPHQVGVSFPKRNMTRVVSMTKFGLLMKWWKESSGVRVFCGILYLVLFGIFFYRTSGGTGTCLFIPAVIGLVVWWSVNPIAHFFFPLLLLVVWLLVARMAKNKHHKYLPPIKSVPGGGIKRGLAVPEAAVILEEPLGRVLALVMFGMLKKNLVTLDSDNPLKVSVVPGYEVTRADRRNVARDRGTVVRGYEQRFLEAILEKPAKAVKDLDLREAMKYMVENVAKRMKGFDFEETKEYYRSITAKAWAEAKQIGEVEARDKYVDDNLLWLMMAPDYNDQFEGWHSRGYHYYPSWTGSGSGSSAPSVPSGPAVGGRTSIGDVAASFAGWSENVTGNLANSIDPVSVGLSKGGVINLAGVDKVGVDVLEGLAESGGSGGGGGGGCACAGCACACACAGGGR